MPYKVDLIMATWICGKHWGDLAHQKDRQQRNCGQPIHKPYSQLLFYFIFFQCNSKCQTTNLEWKLKQLVDEPEMYI